MFLDLTNFLVVFFTDTVLVRSFKLCIIITSLWIYQSVPGLMTLTLFQGHMCVRILHWKLFFRFFPSEFKHCMVLTYTKKTRHSMLCVTGVYLGDLTNMIFFFQF